MEEQEVELMDYLRVLWRGKWVIAVCFLVAVGVAAALTWTRPATYSGGVLYRLTETLSTFGVGTLNQGQLLSAAREVGSSFAGTKVQFDVQQEGDGIRATLAGQRTREELRTSLDQLTVSLRAKLETWVRGEVDRTIAAIGLQISQLTRERDLLKLRVGELGTQGTENPLPKALAEQVAKVEAELAYQQARLDVLQSTTVASLFTVEEVSRSPVTRDGPSLRLNLAVAGILGLFIGTLLAFFLHYLADARERERERAAP